MTVFRVTVRDPHADRTLMIERLSLADALIDYALLARDGWRLVGDPVAVQIPDCEEVAAA